MWGHNRNTICRSRGRAGYDERSGSRRHRYEYGREYDRDRREAGRMSAERKTRRRKDEERRKDGDNTRHRRRRSEERERISQRRSPRAQRERPSGLDADNKPSKAERSSQTFSAGQASKSPKSKGYSLPLRPHQSNMHSLLLRPHQGSVHYCTTSNALLLCCF